MQVEHFLSAHVMEFDEKRKISKVKRFSNKFQKRITQNFVPRILFCKNFMHYGLRIILLLNFERISEENNHYGIKFGSRCILIFPRWIHILIFTFSEFEGEKISHLVKQDEYKVKKEDEEETGQQQEDDYVLHRLFKKTGQ